MFGKRNLTVWVAVLLTMVMLMTACTPSVREETVESEKMEFVEVQGMSYEETTETQVIVETEAVIEVEQEYTEKFTEVPLYNQLDYPETRYGDSTIKKSGCGITSYAMVLTYLLDREILPDQLAEMYHKYKVKGGSSHSLFTETQEEWGLAVENCYWGEAWGQGKVMEALRNGQPIIVNVHGDSAFTEDGHFIVLYGLTEDGKILVRDPNGGNYQKNSFLDEGFANGFEPEYFSSISANYFIYNEKDLTAIAQN